EDKPNTLNLDDYIYIGNYEVNNNVISSDIRVQVVICNYGWFSRCVTDEIITIINDRRLARGQKPLSYDHDLESLYTNNKQYRCDPDLVYAVKSLSLDFDIPTFRINRRIYPTIVKINALSYKHDTWNLESCTNNFYEEGADFLTEDIYKAIFLENQSRKAKDNNANANANANANPEPIIPDIQYKQKQEKLISDLESVNYKLVQENSKLKYENQNLIDENLKYENVKETHKKLLTILQSIV
ncbi:MAG: hypothetical protein WD512_07775, partial [Candidatus Paceibacterota bacterium]